jgi:hypothetical protein
MLHALRDLEDSRLTAAHRLVLSMMLACREGEGGRVRPERRGTSAPSVRRLTQATALSERTVHRALADLRTWGYLVVKTAGTPTTATVYGLSLPDRGASLAGEGCQGDTPQTARGARVAPPGATVAPLGVPGWQGRGARVAPFADLSADHVADHPADPSLSESPTAPLVTAGAATSVEPLRLAIDGESESKKPSKATNETSGDVLRVWGAYLACWRRVVGQGAEPALTPKRRALLAKRLRTFSTERIIRAIEGLFGSSHHRGQNDTGTRYLEIEQVIRADERVEKFEGLALAPKTPVVRRPSNGVIRQAPAPDALAPWRRRAVST